MSTQKKGTSPLVGLAVVAVIAGIGVAIAVHLHTASKSRVSGTLTIDGAPFSPTRCRSGKGRDTRSSDRLRFDGVDLLAASGPVVRLMNDPAQGRVVLIVPAGGDPERVDRAACGRYDLQLRETGEAIFSVWGMEGSVELDCPRVTGSVQFGSCFDGD